MGRGLSIYLDLLRLLASVEVVLFHFAHVGPRNPLHVWGHEAVVVFFVLSGFVIRHAVATKDRSLEQFAASRLSRLYSAIIPCLLLTMIFDYVGSTIAPKTYAHIDIPGHIGVALMKLYSSLFMLDQTWEVKSFYSNASYWSVCYEFWFYCLFAIGFYVRGPRRWIGFVIVGVLGGPRMLLLFPLWLLGGIAYSERVSNRCGRAMLWLGFAQPIAVLAVYVLLDLPLLGRELFPPALASWLGDAAQVSSDLVLGLSLACHFACAKQLDGALVRWFGWSERYVRWGAARSFTLYLLHLPTMYLLAALSVAWTGAPGSWLTTIGTFAIPLLLARRIEGWRHDLLPPVKRLVSRWLSPSPQATANASV